MPDSLVILKHKHIFSLLIRQLSFDASNSILVIIALLRLRLLSVVLENVLTHPREYYWTFQGRGEGKILKAIVFCP